MNDNWIYIGIFLDNKSKNLLKKKYPIPAGWNEYYDHMTVVFNDSTDIADAVKSINEKNINKKFKLKVQGPGISDKAFAIRVELPNGVVCANKISHITLGTSSTGKAVDSNYITNWSTTFEDIYVTGKMEAFCADANLYGINEDSYNKVIIDEANVY